MDIGMPGMDGVQAAQAIKSDSATAPIPIKSLTGQSLIRSWSQLRQAGSVSYLTSPASPAAYEPKWRNTS
jgi:CheY-like chemotaxis protein